MNKYPRVGIGVLIFNSCQEVLLGKRLQSHGKMTWSPPGGHLEFKESFEECGVREVLEETGLILQDLQFVGLTNDIYENEEKHYLSVIMRANLPVGQEVQNLEPHKTESWHWFKWRSLPEPLFFSCSQLKSKQAYGIGSNLKNKLLGS